ncbi:expressed conserved protein [Echinococcus multilocularis]|uniref:Expressed conserved protein n=1 Tax=Echinococcus multilocularis TaxID=6211 RepID=A0A068XUI7_ECHMU|nr:expressed conserved protein [Echinococcus multilocularis]
MNMQEQRPVYVGEGSLSNSYHQGFNNAAVVNTSPVPPIFENHVRGPQVNRTRGDSPSPMRFCVQTKDRFVVRVVKITDKKTFQLGVSADSPTSTPVEPLKAILYDPQKMQNIERLILEAIKGNNPPIYIGFQAQLPAIALGYVLKSTSADQVNTPNMLQNYRQCRLGKGVRLCFTCPLLGRGLNIQDFFSGKVFQRLTSWEKCSRQPGVLVEALQALKKSVDWMLQQIQLNGLRTVLPEVDYIFYPCAASPLLSTERASRQLSMVPPGQGIQQHQRQQQNPLLATLINSSRPLSAYGSCFDGARTENVVTKSLDRQISSSVGDYGSSLHQLSEYNPYETRYLKELQQPSTGTSSIISICHTDCNEAPTDQTCNGSLVSASASPPSRWLSNLVSAINPALERGKACGTSPVYLSGVNPQKAVKTSSSLSQENDFMAALINEVVDRLRKSPHLPLVVMPTQTPGSPPIVFQLPSSDVIFVGLPATTGQNGHERPRLVTSPADSSAFVVTSKRTTSSTIGVQPLNYSAERPDDPPFTVSAPHPGCILGVSPEGDLYEFKPS